MSAQYESLLCYINQQSGARAGIFMNDSRPSTWGWNGEFSSPLCDLSVCFSILNGSLYLRCLGLGCAAWPKWAPQNGHPSLLNKLSQVGLPLLVSGCASNRLWNIFLVFFFLYWVSVIESFLSLCSSAHLLMLFPRLVSLGGLHIQHKSIPSCLCSGIIRQHFHFPGLPEAPGIKKCDWVCERHSRLWKAFGEQ